MIFFGILFVIASLAADAAASPQDHAPATIDAPSSHTEIKTPVIETATPSILPSSLTQSLLRIGEIKLAVGDSAAAIIAFRQVAESRPAPAEAVAALLGLARSYDAAGESVKAVATYEHLLQKYRDDPQTPTILLEDGRILRRIGSSKLALARFYSVIHTSLKLTHGDGSDYRKLVQAAQFEIAETHLQSGDYEAAIRFFKRFELLDVSAADRAWAQFKVARALMLADHKTEAVTSLQDFITRNPTNENTPEAHFLLSSLLDQMGQHDESLRVTLSLLQSEHAKSQGNQARWRQWQQRTGRQLANTYYERGEFNSAFSLYRALADLDSSPAWRLPQLYQQGLCLERLMQYAQALETYATLIEDAGETMPTDLAEIVRMAEWRRDQINWWQLTQQNLQALNPSDPAPTPSPL
jgi:tetratricopeptide (TPR) repeat protein